jgi:hypothetical protein
MTAQSHPGGRHGAPGPLCGARTRSGTACTQPPAPGSTRCRYHGGHSCRGAASGTWKHGRYSKYLPTGLAGRSVNRHVRDAGARQAIAYDLSLFITSARAGQAPPPVALPGPAADDPGPAEA